MKTVTVERLIHAPREAVFDCLTDHAGYDRFPGIRRSQLLREGEQHRNGVGALREIDAGALWVQEAITAYEPGTRMDYLIERSRPPLRHEGGSLRFSDADGGTRVVWTSTFELAIPLIGGLLTPIAAGRIEKAFGGMLAAVAKRLEA